MELGEIVQNDFGDVFFSGVNGESFINQSALTLFEAYIFPQMTEKNRLYIIFGTDSGLLANAVEKRFSDDVGGRLFLFLEHSSVLEKFGILKFPHWIKICAFQDELIDLLSNDYYYASSFKEGNVFPVSSIALIDKNPSYLMLEKSMSSVLDEYLLGYSSMTRMDLFFNAIFFNANDNLQPLSRYKNYFSGMRAVIVAGGPSLDESIHWIKENQSQLIVFAVARVAKRLFQEGIRVHFFLSIDPTTDSFFNSRDMLSVDYPCCLINSHHVFPGLLSQWKGVSLYFGSLFPWQENVEPLMFMGNTVTHAALGAAVALGAETIYLAGVDFCFRDGNTHAQGSMENDFGKYYIAERTVVKTFAGQLAETSSEFNLGREAIEKQVAFCQNNNLGVKFYNLSEQAAFVKGVDLYDMNHDVCLKDEGFNVRYQSLLITLNCSHADQLSHANMVSKTIQEKRQLFSQAIKLASEGVKLSRAEYDNEGAFVSAKMHKVEKKLIALLLPSINFVTQLDYHAFSAVNRFEKHYQVGQKELSVATFIRYYQLKFTTFFDALTKAIAMIDGALQRALQHKRFLEGKLPLKQLAPVWIERGEPGMVYRWINAFPDKADLTENKVYVDQLIEAYRHFLFDAQGGQQQTFLKQASDIDFLLVETEKAVQLKDITELSHLSVALSKAVDLEEEKRAVSTLFYGLVSVIEQQLDKAMVAFDQTHFSRSELEVFLLKEKLKLSFVLNLHESIVDTYQKLCFLDPEFLLAFAGYWLAVNQPQEALFLLQGFLRLFPLDIEGHLRLFKSYIALRDHDAAELVYERLQVLMPNNPELFSLSEQLKNA